MACISALVLLEIGSPVLFWQQRVGALGRNFLVYKFRTLRAPFDRRGRPLREDERLSTVGRLLRATHLDELPQLLNVLVGDMSLVGPRPLLPIDQPADPTVRLTVRPGMTGWAQIHGGKNISIAEKAALDEWYVRNLSLGLDLHIVIATVLHVMRGGSSESWAGDAALGENDVRPRAGQ
jgi:lipopolysaccharide/colanic/teichoic acid biosynthesis glycosyltransferase